MFPEKTRRLRAQPPPEDLAPLAGWRHARIAPSLEEVYRSIPVTATGRVRKFLAFAGPV